MNTTNPTARKPTFAARLGQVIISMIHPRLMADLRAAIDAGDAKRFGALLRILDDQFCQFPEQTNRLADDFEAITPSWQDWQALEEALRPATPPTMPKGIGGATDDETYWNVQTFIMFYVDGGDLPQVARDALRFNIDSNVTNAWTLHHSEIVSVTYDERRDRVAILMAGDLGVSYAYPCRT